MVGALISSSTSWKHYHQPQGSCEVSKESVFVLSTLRYTGHSEIATIVAKEPQLSCRCHHSECQSEALISFTN